MLNVVVGIYDTNTGEFIKGVPYIYNNNSWERALPKVYSNSTWKDIGGAGEFFYKYLAKNETEGQSGRWYNTILIRERNYDRWVDKNGLPIYVKDRLAYPGDPATMQFVFEHTVERVALRDSNLAKLLDSDSNQLIVIEEA